MSFNRVCLLYLYLAVAMVLCFVLGNVTAHSQKANTSPTPAVKPPFVNNLDGWRQKQFFNGGGSYMPLAIPQETERFPLMNYFASGDAFYLDMESFEPTANGKLNYKIVGKNLFQTDGQDAPTQESSNEVDCLNGTFRSQTSRMLFDKNGNVISRDNFMNVPSITLTPGSSLYNVLKNACQDNFTSPEQPLKWVK